MKLVAAPSVSLRAGVKRYDHRCAVHAPAPCGAGCPPRTDHAI